MELLKLDAEEHQLVLTAHHIICDGWSWAVIVTELGNLYSAINQGATAELEESDKLRLPAVRFSDYALMLEAEANDPRNRCC